MSPTPKPDDVALLIAGPVLTTEEDRKHLCTYRQAYAAAPDSPESPMVDGKLIYGPYSAVNETTGHAVLCADVFIAHGYVSASRALRPNEVFSLHVGDVRIDQVEHHPDMLTRLADPDWFEKVFSNAQYASDEDESPAYHTER